MKLSPEKLASVAHIPTHEVKTDLLAAQLELNGYEVEMRAIESVGINMTNKVRHFFLSAKVDKGREFIDELNQILAARQQHESHHRETQARS